MRCEWKQVTLNDITDVLGDGIHGTPIYSPAGEYAFINGNNLVNGQIQIKNSTKRVDITEFEKHKRPLSNRTILVSINGTLGNVAVYRGEKIILGKSACYFNVSENVDKDFIQFVIMSPDFQSYLQNRATGTTIKNVSLKQMREYTFWIPPVKIQKSISAILLALNDKIELNQRINENLERQAEAVFQSWFVDFEPFTGMQPQSWKTVTLDTITTLISRGITPKYIEESNQIILNQKCIRNHAIDLSLARRHQPKTVNEKWLQFGDLLINSTGAGTLGRTAQVWFVPQNMTADSHITIVRPKDELLIHYIGLWGITHEKEIESLHTGSTGQTELPRERVKSLELLLPDDETLCRFHRLIQPIAESMVARQEENQRLAEVRDALLPKLMSGEIDVSNIQSPSTS